MSKVKIVESIFGKAGRAMTKIKNAKATPKVMMVTGIVTIVGAGVYACVQTMKLEDKVDEAKENIEHIKELKEEGEYVVDTETGETDEYTPALYRKDLAWAYGQAGWSIAKLYLPSLVATGIGVALVGGSNKLLSDKLAQMTMTATMLSESYNQYRKNVIADQGEEADRRYRLGLETKKNLEMNVIDPETGEVVNKKEKKIDVVMDVKDIASPYAVCLNDCGFWTSDPTYNTQFIEAALRIAQAKYDRDGFIYLYDIWSQLGALEAVNPAAIAMSHQVGLVKGTADDEIKIDLIPSHLGSEDYFKDILLMDINCCGPINELVAGNAFHIG